MIINLTLFVQLLNFGIVYLFFRKYFANFMLDLVFDHDKNLEDLKIFLQSSKQAVLDEIEKINQFELEEKAKLKKLALVAKEIKKNNVSSLPALNFSSKIKYERKDFGLSGISKNIFEKIQTDWCHR